MIKKYLKSVSQLLQATGLAISSLDLKNIYIYSFLLGQVLVVAHGVFVVAYELSCPKACGILVLQTEIGLMFPALESGFLTTGLPGKSWLDYFLLLISVLNSQSFHVCILYLQTQGVSNGTYLTLCTFHTDHQNAGTERGLTCLLIVLYKILFLLLKVSDQIRSDQLLSCVRLFATPGITARQASLFITNSRSSLRLTSIESVMPSSHLILCRPLLLLPPIPPSIRLFSTESTLRMRWPKYWSFSFSIIPSKEIPGLISFRMDWLDSLQSKGLSRVFSNTTLQKHQFFGAQPSSQSNSHIHT